MKSPEKTTSPDPRPTSVTHEFESTPRDIQYSPQIPSHPAPVNLSPIGQSTDQSAIESPQGPITAAVQELILYLRFFWRTKKYSCNPLTRAGVFVANSLSLFMRF